MLMNSTVQSSNTKYSQPKNDETKEKAEQPSKTPRSKSKRKGVKYEENEIDKLFEQIAENNKVTMPNQLRDKIAGSVAAKKIAEKK